MFAHTLSLAALASLLFTGSVLADPEDPVPEVQSDIHGVAIENCDDFYTLVVLVGRGQEGCNDEGETCSGQVLVLLVSAGDHHNACSGEDDACSGNTVLLVIGLSSETDTCEGESNACNGNEIALWLYATADNSKTCFVGQSVAASLYGQPLGVAS